MTEPSRSSKNHQTTLPSEQLGKGKVPPDALCEFCGARRATLSFQFVRKLKGGRGGHTPTGMFMYTCETCKDLGEKATAKPRPAL